MIMKLRDAKKLHNEDEVTIKGTGAHATVCSTELSDDGKTLWVDCFYNGLTRFSHKEIK